jgi:hypothetical protein
LHELKGRGLWRGVIDDGFISDGRRRQRYVHAKGVSARRGARHDVVADGEHLKQRLESAELPARP